MRFPGFPLFFAGFAAILGGAALVADAQPPGMPPRIPATPSAAATPPAPIAVPPASAANPASTAPEISSAGDTPLSRFENLVSFPAQTQAAVRAVLLSATWMTRMNQSHGRFIAGFNPALRQPLPRDHDLHQARAALAMAQLAKFMGDERHAAIASQSILTLCAATKVDAADPTCRTPVHSSLVCNRVGFAATLVLAIHSLPAPDATLLTQAEQLTQFLHKQCLTDGSIHYTDGVADNSIEVDPAGLNEYPGIALQAIIVSHRLKPATWKMEAVKKGVAYYQNLCQSRPHPLLAATLTPAAAELYLQARSNDAANCVFELNDILGRCQIQSNDTRTPQNAGGFRTSTSLQNADQPSGPETGFYLQSLACARQIARLTGDIERHAKYRSMSMSACNYLTELQYVETNTRHYENAFRANMLIGAFHLTPTDGTIRIDASATAVTGLLQFLAASVDRD
jgi:hypothetical protein